MSPPGTSRPRDPGGCAATSGYQQFLGVDDDNGNLADGTPHMQAIFSAFDRHHIACATPAVQDSGCAGAPTAAPAGDGPPADRGAFLSWDPVADATRYKIFRGDGVFQCDFGKAIVGEMTGTGFADSGLQNGHEYSYVVAGFGDSGRLHGADQPVRRGDRRGFRVDLRRRLRVRRHQPLDHHRRRLVIIPAAARAWRAA